MRKVEDEAPAASWLMRSGSISEQMARQHQVFWHRPMSHCTSRNIHLRCPLRLEGMLGDPRDTLWHGWGWKSPFFQRKDVQEVPLLLSPGLQPWEALPTHPRGVP